MKMNLFRAALLVLCMIPAVPAAAQTPGVPKSFVPSICASPAPTTTAVSVCLNDGNGVQVPWLNFNPATHLAFTPGVAAETARALAAEALLAPLASPQLTGIPTAPTAAAGTSTTQLATTAFTAAAVGTETTRAQAAEALLAPLASPVLTGTPTAPTPSPGDNSLKLPTTAFVSAAVLVEANRATAAEGANTTAITAEATTARNASNLTSGTVPAARLPTPTTSTLGGVQALPASGNFFLTGIGTNGVPTAAQPSFGNLSGLLAAIQFPGLSGDVTAPSGSLATTLASTGVTAGSFVLPTVTFDAKGRATAATQGTLSGDVATTLGSLTATIQPGVVTNAKLANAPAGTLKGNLTGSSAAPADNTLSAYLDAATSSAQGSVLYRSTSGWLALAPGTSGQFLQTLGSGANPAWAAVTGSNGGTVTSVGTGAGLAGGPITSTGTLTAADNLMQGRLTLASGTPVMTSTVSAATAVLYTPYIGNLVALWNGSTFVEATFSEYSQALSDTTYSPSAAVANACYDDFVWNSSGTVRATRGPTWSAGATAGSNTARGSGAGSTALVRTNGVLVNQYAITNGPAAGYGTFLGTFCTDAGAATVSWVPTAAPTAGGATLLLDVWNMYNREDVGSMLMDSTASWTYATAAWRPADNSAGANPPSNRISFVRGLNEGSITARYTGFANAPGTNSASPSIGIGVDSISAPSGTYGQIAPSSGAGGTGTHIYEGAPGLGLHYVTPLEYSIGGATVTFYGAQAAVQTGLTARFRQ